MIPTIVQGRTMSKPRAMRPIERRILQLEASGVHVDEIARRFRRSPGHITRVIEMASLPGRSGVSSDRDGLRALERRVLDWRRQGADHEEIGRRFKRSAAHIRQIEGLALYKQSMRLLGG